MRAMAAALLASACASAFQTRPDWVDGSSAAYPEKAWVTGAATGADPDQARRNARTELARVFSSRVESEVRDQASATTVTVSGGEGDGAPRSSVVENLSIDTRIRTEGSFEGVRVVETWRDPDTGAWHALAVVEKQALRRSLVPELEAAARRVRGALERAGSAPTALGRAQALLDALHASRERDVLVARARVVGLAAEASSPGSAEIERQLDAVLWNTRFLIQAVEVDPATGRPGASLPGLHEALAKRITRIGFRVVGDGADPGVANVWLTCRMSLEEVPRDFDGHFFRWQGAYELTGKPPDGPVILASQASGGESYSTRPIARTRALTKGAEQLAGDLEKQISRYLTEPLDH